MKLHVNPKGWMLTEQPCRQERSYPVTVQERIHRNDIYCRSEQYPIRQWHMVRNKAFVLRDLKIRIVFPLNQWGVCFTAMNNASLFQISFPRSHPFPLSPYHPVFAMPIDIQCLKCFYTSWSSRDLDPSPQMLRCFLMAMLPSRLMRTAGVMSRDVMQWYAPLFIF